MARTMGPVYNTIGVNPYPPVRDKEPDVFICELCDRRIGSKDWTAHKNSKKHRAYEDEARRSKDRVATGTSGADQFVDQGAWVQDDGASYQHGGTDQPCYGCGEKGHLKRDCPQNQRAGGGNRGCYLCGENGHLARECPNNTGDGRSKEGCFNCGEPGHLKVDCPVPQRRQGGGGGQACYNCQNVGHVSKDCPNERVLKCRNCDAIGHMARECPKPRDYSRVQCNNCKEFGHTVVRCNAPVAEDSNGGGGWDESGAVAASSGWDNDTAPADGSEWDKATAGGGW